MLATEFHSRLCCLQILKFIAEYEAVGLDRGPRVTGYAKDDDSLGEQ